MKLLLPALLAASSASAFFPQRVLQDPHKALTSWSKTLSDLQALLRSLTGEARALWDEVAVMFPEAMDKTSFYSTPKKHTRKPNSHWEFVMKGSDVQSLWTANEQGEQERELDGKLEAYALRSKAVDPSALGVDPNVKQLSGYLDDEENDKHLFYWFFESRGNPETDPVSYISLSPSARP